MIRLLKADLYRVLRSKLTLIALLLAVGFPILTVLLYSGLKLIGGIAEDPALGSLFSANTIIGTVYSLSNNVGLVVPAFAGILVCLDYSNGTLRNKVIAGNRRSQIYLSHLTVSILFSVVIISVYALLMAGLALIFFPFTVDPAVDLGLEIFWFIMNGTLTFAFMATVSTLFAMIFRSTAPTIIFTIVFSIALYALTSVLMAIDLGNFKYAAYFIPTFSGNFFSLSSFGALGMFGQTAEASKWLMFAEGTASFFFFGAVNTVIGLYFFKKRDIR
ncbi:MAG: ABC transporter permease [Clostridia bacterium]|nr:ABC transporter permease [Clostridia bacterium]